MRAAGIGQRKVEREALGERGGVVARGTGEVVGHNARLPVHVHPGRHADDEAGYELRLAVGIERGARIGGALAVGRGEYIILRRERDGAEHAGAGEGCQQLRRAGDGREAHEGAIAGAFALGLVARGAQQQGGQQRGEEKQFFQYLRLLVDEFIRVY